MSSSEPSQNSGRVFPFRVRSDSDDLKITIYDPRNRELISGTSEVSLVLPVGLYLVRTEFAGQLRQSTVLHDRPTEIDESLVIYSAAPLAKAVTSHEYYVQPSVQFSKRETRSPIGDGPRSSRLLIFIRCSNERVSTGENLAANLRLTDSNGEHVSAFAKSETKQDRRFGWLAFSALAMPGFYRLRFTGKGAREVPIHLFADWEHQIFVTYHGRPLLEGMRHFMARRGEGFQPDDEIASAIDSALTSLQNRAGIPEKKTRNLLLDGKFENPMLGLIGAHLLFAEKEPDSRLVDIVLKNLGRLIPGSPDVAALKMRAMAQFQGEMSSKPLARAPQLRAGLQAVLRAAVDHPELIAEESEIEKVAPRLLADSPWTSWLPETPGRSVFGRILDFVRSLVRYSFESTTAPPDFDWIQAYVLRATVEAERARREFSATDVAREIGIPTRVVVHAQSKLQEFSRSQISNRLEQLPDYARGNQGLSRGALDATIAAPKSRISPPTSQIDRKRPATENGYMLRMEGISKQFPGVRALSNVQLHVRRGTVHALLGENGAGKSTLMKCLIGIYAPDSGTITFRGERLNITNTRYALSKGISMIHQELSPIPQMTVAENIYLGHEPVTWNGLVDMRKMNRMATELLERLSIKIKPTAKMCGLSIANVQLTEIAKAVSYNSDLIIMDEPTSAITKAEVEVLFRIIRSLKAQGCAIIYISNKMDEVFQITDEVTVFRDGQYISTDPTADLTEGKLIEKMVGRTLTYMFHKETTNMGSVLLDVQNLSGKGFRNVSFQVKRGEILGIAGLMGAGRTELMEGVFGVTQTHSGTIRINGKEVTIKSPADAIRGGMALMTEDRKLTGLFLNASVRENMFIANINRYMLGPFVNFGKIAKDCEKMRSLMRIKTPSLMEIIRNLSGGNQQKVLIARWLLTDPDLLILDEPTRGIDVGTKSEIYRLMTEFVRSDKAIVMISSELPEVLGLSDRIMVMHTGDKVGELSQSEATQEKILQMAAGMSLTITGGYSISPTNWPNSRNERFE